MELEGYPGKCFLNNHEYFMTTDIADFYHRYVYRIIIGEP